jgi:hypothetical protein
MIRQIHDFFLLPIFKTYLNARMSTSNISVCAIRATQPQREKANGEKLFFEKLDSDCFEDLDTLLHLAIYVIGTYMNVRV